MTTEKKDALFDHLLNDYQRGFPLVSEPFAEIAKVHKTTVAAVLKMIKSLKANGLITRVGPVFRPNTVGVSTLAAMKIPADLLEVVADLVNQYSEVNHNYEREHDYNVWFVATAPDKHHLESTLRDIEEKSGFEVMRLPLLKEFHIDLGFNLSKGAHKYSSPDRQEPLPQQPTFQLDEAIQQQLVAEIQTGLPLVEQPYAEIATKLGVAEQDIIKQLQTMLNIGIIRRMGVIVRHRELGYRANAMLVWDFPDEHVNKMGKILSTVDCVTLCYQRPRHLPHWPYNLFTMIHGKDRPSVEKRIAKIVEAFELADIPKATLFSKRRFKQKGACYSYVQPETNDQLASNE